MTPSSSHWTGRRLLKAGIACLLLAAIVAGARLAWGRFGLGRTVPLSGLRELGDITCLTFPERSSQLYGDYERTFEQHVRAVVALPPGKVSEFVQQPMLSRWPPSSIDRFVQNKPWEQVAKSGWPPDLWRPDSARRFLSGGIDFHGYLAQWSWLVDLDDPDRALLYLVYWDKGPGNARAAVAEFGAEATRKQKDEAQSDRSGVPTEASGSPAD